MRFFGFLPLALFSAPSLHLPGVICLLSGPPGSLSAPHCSWALVTYSNHYQVLCMYVPQNEHFPKKTLHFLAQTWFHIPCFQSLFHHLVSLLSKTMRYYLWPFHFSHPNHQLMPVFCAISEIWDLRPSSLSHALSPGGEYHVSGV